MARRRLRHLSSRRRRHRLSSRDVGVSPSADVYLTSEAGLQAASPDFSKFGGSGPMFSVDDVWLDFESASALDLKAAGTLRYATDASTRAIVLAYAIGNSPAR